MSRLKLALMPPTDGALKEHVKRVYLQVQCWIGNDLNPCEWGWKNTGQILEPIFFLDPLIPENLMKKYNCGCRTGCNNRCSCRNLGKNCSRFCKFCKGMTCSNGQEDQPNDALVAVDNITDTVTHNSILTEENSDDEEEISLQQICHSFGIACNDDDEMYFHSLCENSEADDDEEESDSDDNSVTDRSECNSENDYVVQNKQMRL